MNFERDIQAEELVLMVTGEQIPETLFQRCMTPQELGIENCFLLYLTG